MQTRILTFLGILTACMLFIGCAQKMAYTPADLNMKLSSGAAVQKTDNFVVLYDSSASMAERYKASTRSAHAEEITRGMITTIPDIQLKSGLRNFGGSKGEEKTELVYGMTSFNRNEFLQSMDKIGLPVGRTPLGRAITAAGVDMMSLPGKSAIIIVSDFQDIKGIDDIRLSSVIGNTAAVKAQFGDGLCIYAVQVGDVPSPGGEALARNVVREGKCGFNVNADDLKTPAAMSAFVEKIFLGPPPEAVMEAKKEPLTENRLSPVETATVIENIYFDFDKYFLRAEAKKVLGKLGEFMKTTRDATVLIEGHCDERGTSEYNLALGQRRASSAAEYLFALGVAMKRVFTVSYGKERPIDPGHTEEAWAKNRRAQFIINRNK